MHIEKICVNLFERYSLLNKLADNLKSVNTIPIQSRYLDLIRLHKNKTAVINGHLMSKNGFITFWRVSSCSAF